jgi:hypothetical protein
MKVHTMTEEQKEIAREAAKARWAKRRQQDESS